VKVRVLCHKAPAKPQQGTPPNSNTGTVSRAHALEKRMDTGFPADAFVSFLR
jgi:hypothetical protein